MTSSTAGWTGPIGSRSPALTQRDPLVSKQYGPSWVANIMGTTHEQRLDALTTAGWTTAPDDRDVVAQQYARLMTEQ